MRRNMGVRLKTSLLKVAICLAAAFGATALVAGNAQADAELDKTFNGTGFQITNFGFDAKADAHRLETRTKPNGTIIGLQQSEGRYLLAKYKSDGSSLGNILLGLQDSRLAIPGGFLTQGDNMVVASAGQNMKRGEIYLERRISSGPRDESFGTEGTVTVKAQTGEVSPGGPSRVDAVASDQTGRIYVAARINRSVILRFSMNGELDAGFADGGRLVLAPSSEDGVLEVIPTATGFYVATGDGLFRFDNQGAEDPDFQADLPEGDVTRGFQLTAGGKPLLLRDNHLVRLNPDGSRDQTFSADGRLDQDCGSIAIRSFTLDTDGRILLAGTQGSVGEDEESSVLVRLLPDGSCDASFGAGGRVSLDIDPGFDEATGVVAYPDGRILIAGDLSGDFSPLPSYQARLLESGTLDFAFAGVGWMRIESTLPTNDRLEDLIETSDRYLVALGSTGYSAAIARYLPDGRTDTGFGLDGRVVIGKGHDLASRVLARSAVGMPGGDIVVCLDWGYGVRLVRLDSIGDPVNTFGKGGFRRLEGFTRCSGITRQGKDRLLVGGLTVTGSAVTRLTGNGWTDRRFGRKGIASGPVAETARGVVFASSPDGSSYLAGPESMVKFRPDGGRDRSFSQAGVMKFDGKMKRPWSAPPKALTIDKRGSIYLVRQGSAGRISIFKRKSNGSRAPYYGFGGNLYLHSKAGKSFATDATVKPNGKLVIVGQLNKRCGSIYPCERLLAIYQLRADGRVDKKWSDGLMVGRAGEKSSASAVITGDGKITTGATTSTSGGRSDFLLVRYTG